MNTANIRPEKKFRIVRRTNPYTGLMAWVPGGRPVMTPLNEDEHAAMWAAINWCRDMNNRQVLRRAA